MIKKLSLAFTLGLSVFAAVEEIATTKTEAAVTVNDRFLFANYNQTFEQNASTQLQHEDRVRGEFGNYVANVHFTNAFSPQTFDTSKYFVLEKASLEWTSGDWTLTAGDSAQELGRGIALALFKDPVLGVDNTLQGFAAKYKPAKGEANLFAGRVHTLTSSLIVNPMDNPLIDRDVFLAGAGVKMKTGADTKMGAHYFLALNKPYTSTEPDKRWHTTGATFEQEGIFENVDGYLESNWLVTDNLEFADIATVHGFGSYGSLTYTGNPWKIKLEGRDNRDYSFEFRRPPTLEEDIIDSVNTTDVSTARLSVENRPVGGSRNITVSYLFGEDRSYQSAVHHPVVGAKFKSFWKSEWEAKVGYRYLPQAGSLRHAMIKSKFPFGKAQAIEVSLRKQFKEEIHGPVVDPTDRNLVDITYSFNDALSLALGYEYRPTNPVEAGVHFGNVSANYKSGAFTGRAVVGSTAAGTMCSGGVCRQVPAFSGVMAETAYQF